MRDLRELSVQYITNEAGEKTAVVLPLEQFRELIEDIEDLAVIAGGRDEPADPYEGLLEEMRRYGAGQVTAPPERIRAFCERWQVMELALFGSVLTDAFGPKSDVDVLVRFSDEAGWSLLDMVAMQEELEQLLGRPVDLVEADALRNPFRRQRILSVKRVIYAAPSP